MNKKLHDFLKSGLLDKYVIGDTSDKETSKVETYLDKYPELQEEYEIKGNNFISVMAESMTTEMINNGLSKVDELWGVEVGLIAEGLYAGTSDAIGIYEGEEAIIDFKTSNKTALTVGLEISNLLNTSYRNYLNRLRLYADDLGRNFLLTFKLNY